MPTIVAFLDVLGFSSHSESDLAGAIGVLLHQKTILEQKLSDGTHHPATSYNDPSLVVVANAHLVDSFLHFLPGSDSTFVVSEEPDKFVRQLSHLLIECLELVGHAYADADDPQRPETVAIKDLLTGHVREEHWFPPLWSGGLATGTLQTFPVTGISNSDRLAIPNLAGTAVVKAVRVASTARGPRLFCEAGFEQLFGNELRPFFRPHDASVCELLWPAFAYMDGADPTVEIQHFHDLWRPAVALWKSKRGHRAFEHFDEFLRLLIHSLVAWGDTVEFGNEARRLARDRIQADLAPNLIATYLD